MTALLIGYAVAITIVFFASRTFSINRPRHTHTSAVKIHCRRALARSGGTPHPPTPARPNTPELGQREGPQATRHHEIDPNGPSLPPSKALSFVTVEYGTRGK